MLFGYKKKAAKYVKTLPTELPEKPDTLTQLNSLATEAEGLKLEWKRGKELRGALLPDGSRNSAYRPADHSAVKPYLEAAQLCVSLLKQCYNKHEMNKVKPSLDLENSLSNSEGLLDEKLREMPTLFKIASKVVPAPLLPQVPSWKDWQNAAEPKDMILPPCICGRFRCKHGASCLLLLEKAKTYENDIDEFLRAVLKANGAFGHRGLRYLNYLSGQQSLLVPTEPLPKPPAYVLKQIRRRNYKRKCLLDLKGSGCPRTLKGDYCCGGRKCQKLYKDLWAVALEKQAKDLPWDKCREGKPPLRSFNFI